MTNQEAMRGRAREYWQTKFYWQPPPQIEENVANLMTHFTSQEVASRDARIAKLEAALNEITEQCYTHHCIYIAEKALKEQP